MPLTALQMRGGVTDPAHVLSQMLLRWVTESMKVNENAVAEAQLSCLCDSCRVA